jgi:hypothetical protein
MKVAISKNRMFYHQIVCISLSHSLFSTTTNPWFIYTHMLPLEFPERAENEDETI